MAKVRITALERVTRVSADDLMVLLTEGKTKRVTFLDFNLRLRIVSD